MLDFFKYVDLLSWRRYRLRKKNLFELNRKIYTYNSVISFSRVERLVIKYIFNIASSFACCCYNINTCNEWIFFIYRVKVTSVTVNNKNCKRWSHNKKKYIHFSLCALIIKHCLYLVLFPAPVSHHCLFHHFLIFKLRNFSLKFSFFYSFFDTWHRMYFKHPEFFCTHLIRLF